MRAVCLYIICQCIKNYVFRVLVDLKHHIFESEYSYCHTLYNVARANRSSLCIEDLFAIDLLFVKNGRGVRIAAFCTPDGDDQSERDMPL